jgi:hypothetical protein
MKHAQHSGHCVGDGRPVVAAELDGVHQQRSELVQGHAMLPSVGQWELVVVCGERSGAEAAEHAHHRQIELAMSTVRGWIDQPVPAPAVD